VVVDLAVLGGPDVPALVAQRLVTACDVDDAETSCAKGHPRPLNEAIVVRPAVTDDGRHALEHQLIQRRTRESIYGEGAGNPAHV
jgi:hypothetical protein